MKNFLGQNAIQVLTLFIILVLAVRIVLETKPYAAGDGPEYSLMTEALFNHLSPNVEPADCESFKVAYKKTDKWEENDKVLAYEETQAFIANTTFKKLDYGNAFFVDKDGKKYSCHFFVYSLVNLPMRWIASIFHFNPLRGFYFTNLLLIIGSCLLFFKYSKYGKLETAAFVLLFFFSTNYWYLCWTHPEVFTVCFVSVGLWAFFQKKQFTGILLVSIAALQNQPIALLVALLCAVVLVDKGFNIKNCIKIGISSFLIFLPSAFYYYHYGVTNLINYEWPLDVGNITTNRVVGFFFDLNQGMILALPFILFTYICLIAKKITRLKFSPVKWDVFIPIVIVAMTITASAIVAWNMGQAIVNRYVTYIGAIVLVHFFMLVMQIENRIMRNTVLIISIITQFTSVIYFQTMNNFDWSTRQPKPISNWMLENYPRFYSPDPSIFIARYTHELVNTPKKPPAFYMKEDGTITKFMAHKDYLNVLKDFEISQRQIDSIVLMLRYSRGWAYLHVSDNFAPVITDEQKIWMQINAIKKDVNWYKAIQEKAKIIGMSVEEVLRRDAAYMLKIKIPLNGTRAEKIQNKISEIKANSSWLNLIETKAREQNISVDTALYRDALWMVEQEGASN